MPEFSRLEAPMRYYRYPETGELVRFNLSTMEWTEMRCDVTTKFDVRWVPVQPLSPDQARALEHVEHEQARQFVAEARQANSAARGELFLQQMRARSEARTDPL